MALKRIALATAAGVAAFAAVGASATTLGGLSTVSLGTDRAVVAACDNDGVALDYRTSYDPATAGYRVAAVTVTGIAEACLGQTLKVTLAADVPVELTATVGADRHTLAVPAGIAAETVASTAITISG